MCWSCHKIVFLPLNWTLFTAWLDLVIPVFTIFCSSELRFPNFSIKYFLQVIQISGSASLYYVVKSELPGPINVKLKQKILSTLLNGMFAHKYDSVMMRNGCLTLCRFQIPQDVVSFDSLVPNSIGSYEILLYNLLRLPYRPCNEQPDHWLWATAISCLSCTAITQLSDKWNTTTHCSLGSWSPLRSA